MTVLSWVLCVVSFLWSVTTYQNVQTSIHQIYAAVGFLITAVLFATAVLAGKLEDLRTAVDECSKDELQWLMNAYQSLRQPKDRPSGGDDSRQP